MPGLGLGGIGLSDQCPRQSFDPSMITSGTLIGWHRADSNLTLDGSNGVSNWGRLFGTKDWAQTAAEDRPIWSNTGGPTGGPIITASGVSQGLNMGFRPVAPATTPIYIAIVARAASWGTGRSLCGSQTTEFRVQQVTSTPTICQNNGTSPSNSNGGFAVGAWTVVQAYFSGSVADWLKAGATMVTGGNAGNNASSQDFALFSRNGGGFFAGDICETVIVSGGMSASDLNGMIDYFRNAWSLSS